MIRKILHLKKEQVPRRNIVVDLQNQCLGRMCTYIAHILHEKDKASYSFHVPKNTYVILKNAKLAKFNSKHITRIHTGYMGGMKTLNWGKIWDQKYQFIILRVIKNMINRKTSRNNILSKVSFMENNIKKDSN